MRLKFFNITALAILFLMAYFFVVGQLSRELFFVLAVGAAVSMLMSGQEKKLITLAEAEQIALFETRKMQELGIVKGGSIRLLGETELKELEIKSKNPKLVSDKYHVGIVIESETSEGRLFKITPKGEIVSKSKILLPSSYSVTATPERTTALGERMSEKKEGESGTTS